MVVALPLEEAAILIVTVLREIATLVFAQVIMVVILPLEEVAILIATVPREVVTLEYVKAMKIREENRVPIVPVTQIVLPIHVIAVISVIKKSFVLEFFGAKYFIFI